MPQNIRAFVPGGTFFFMVPLLERRRQFVINNLGNLREVFKTARLTFILEAIVILPDSLHCL
jgi:putative transposase